MVRLRGNGEKFFGAVSKRFRVFVGRSKQEVKKQIAQRKTSGNNIAFFEWWSNGPKTIKKKLTHKPKFKLTHRHHIVFAKVCLEFINNRRD